MSHYPILVSSAKLDEYRVDLAVCTTCDRERSLDPMMCDPLLDFMECEHCKSGLLTWKYQPVDECPNCGKLGDMAVDGACSRLCLLQHEYAQQLAKERTS